LLSILLCGSLFPILLNAGSGDVRLIYFKPGTLEFEDKNNMESIKAWLEGYKGPVQIEGCYCEADKKKGGDEELLLAVSQRRADRVKVQLINYGLSLERITTSAHGECDPKDACGVRIIKATLEP
jgi:outer membrane protein OmpA-like peptidoglycan-associated protein